MHYFILLGNKLSLGNLNTQLHEIIKFVDSNRAINRSVKSMNRKMHIII